MSVVRCLLSVANLTLIEQKLDQVSVDNGHPIEHFRSFGVKVLIDKSSAKALS